jgi:myo-inositol 2-dehydrogenase/D-chiro-inositol 1-dehydrogenase
MLRYTRARLDAVCDLNRALAERNARVFGALSVYTDAERMLDERKPEGLFIVGPPEVHYSVGKAALARGVPVFVEKPPAPSLGQARELADLARANQVFLMCGFMKRHGMAYAKIREMIDTGRFVPAALRINYSHWGITGIARILPAMSIHAIDLAISLLGEVRAVHSTLYETQRASSLAVTLTFASGRWAQLMLDASQPRIQERLEISGAMDGKNALIIVDNVERMELHLGVHDGTDLNNDLNAINPKLHLEGIQVWRPDYAIPNAQQSRHFFQGFAGEVREFIDAIIEKREPYPGTEDALKAMIVIDAIVGNPNRTVQLA